MVISFRNTGSLLYLSLQNKSWLVVWNMNFRFPYIGNNYPNWLIFCRGVETTSPAFPGAPGASNGPCLVCRPRLFASTWSSPPPRSVAGHCWDLCRADARATRAGALPRGAKVEKFLGKSWKRPRNFSEQLKDISKPCKRSLKVWGLSFDKCNKHLLSLLPKPFQARHIFTHKAMKVTSSYIHCVMWSSHVVGALFRPSCLMVIPYFFDCETTNFLGKTHFFQS